MDFGVLARCSIINSGHFGSGSLLFTIRRALHEVQLIGSDTCIPICSFVSYGSHVPAHLHVIQVKAVIHLDFRP